VWNNFKSNALSHRWSDSTSVWFSIIMLKKHWLSSWQMWLIVSISLGSLLKFRSWFSYHWPRAPVNDASVVLENGEHAFCSGRLSLDFFFFDFFICFYLFIFFNFILWEKWDDGIQVTCFSFPDGSDAPIFCHLEQCCIENHYPHFCSRQVMVNMLPVFGCKLTQHPLNTHFFVTQTYDNLIDTR
jgi:hypothetical protein